MSYFSLTHYFEPPQSCIKRILTVKVLLFFVFVFVLNFNYFCGFSLVLQIYSKVLMAETLPRLLNNRQASRFSQKIPIQVFCPEKICVAQIGTEYLLSLILENCILYLNFFFFCQKYQKAIARIVFLNQCFYLLVSLFQGQH